MNKEQFNEDLITMTEYWVKGSLDSIRATDSLGNDVKLPKEYLDKMKSNADMIVTRYYTKTEIENLFRN